MDNIFSVDVETKSEDEYNPQFALEPYRLIQGKAIITDISLSKPDGNDTLVSNPCSNEVKEMFEWLRSNRAVVFMHNSVFDVAWLYALTKDITIFQRTNIQDTMLLGKWILNGQAMQYAKKDEDEDPGYSLIALCKRFLKTHPLLGDFIAIKEENQIPGENSEYWSRRATFDTFFTRLLAIELRRILPVEQRRGYQISMKSMPFVARSWVDGTPFDLDRVNNLIPRVSQAKEQIAEELGMDTSVIQSSAQLSQVLFDEWGLDPISRGKPKTGYPLGQGSTKADDLKMIALQAQGTPVGPKMKLIMDYKKLQTLESKYLNGFQRVYDYVGEAKCHGAPRMFGTYTGRYTYSSKTERKQIFQNSIAMHQLPRKGPAKSLILAPEGYRVGKYDASGQEIAFMCWASGDTNMLSVLCQGLNIHSWMATNINGMDYKEFVSLLQKNKQAYEDRQAAKLLNLSCQYRIGWKAIQEKFFGTYDKIISRGQANQYLGIYKTTYYGVTMYWKRICIESQEKGYAETIAGRRYQLTDWDSHRWATESSAINTPVQGSGADQKDLIIWLASEKFPEIKFALDIHDEGVFYLPEDHADELNKDIVHFLNGINYEDYWDRVVPMPLVFEGQIGDNFKDCVEYAQPWDDINKMRKDLGVRTYGV